MERDQQIKNLKDLRAGYDSLGEEHNRLADQYDRLKRSKPSRGQQALFDENRSKWEEIQRLSSQLQRQREELG